jgi:hypothetical protein
MQKCEGQQGLKKRSLGFPISEFTIIEKNFNLVEQKPECLGLWVGNREHRYTE